MKRKITIFIIMSMFIIISSCMLISSQTTNSNTNEKDLNSYLTPAKIPDLVAADAETKQALWEGESRAIVRNTAVEDIANYLSQQRWQGDMLTKGSLLLGDRLFNSIVNGLEDSTVGISIKGIDLKVAFNYKGGLAGFLKDRFGYDISGDALNPKIERVLGFDNPQLSWKSKTIIGDGNVYLDLNKIPIGTKVVRYTEGTFILEKYDGTKIVISHTDEEGNVIFKGSESANAQGEKDSIKINPFDIQIHSESGNGIVRFDDKGFSIEGDAIVQIKDMTFTKDDTTQKGSVTITGDRIILNGAKIEIKDYIRASPKTTGESLIVYLGDTKRFFNAYLKQLEGENFGFKVFDATQLEGLAREISFEDKYVPPRQFNEFGALSYKHRPVQLRFDEQGLLSEVRVGDKWLSVSDKNNLRTIRDNTGTFVSGLLDRLVREEPITYFDVKNGFYSDDFLKEGGRELRINTRQENFVSLLGENVGIGGRGELEILRDMNSLSAFDTKGFDVKVGDLEMRFMGQAYQIPRKHTYQNSFAIDDISMTVNGRSLEGRYQIKKENERYLVDDNKRIVAGRVVGIGPFGISFEAYTYVDANDYDKIVQKSENREDLIKELMISSFDQGVTLHLPEGIVRLPIAEQHKKLEEVITTSLNERVFNEVIDLKDLGKYKLKSGTTDNIKNIIRNSLNKLDSLESGRISIGFRNVPSGFRNPQLIISTPSHDLDPIDLTGTDADFIRATLQASARLPDLQKGQTTQTIGVFTVPGAYSGAPHMRDIWRRVFGNRVQLLGTGDYVPDKYYLQTIIGTGFYNRYLENYFDKIE